MKRGVQRCYSCRGVDLTALQSFVVGLRGLHEGGHWWWEYLAMVDVS
jgi:hypothetical protein